MPDATTGPAIQLPALAAQELCQRVLWCIQNAEDALAPYREDVEANRELFDPRPEREESDKPWTDPAPCELHVARCEWTVQQNKADLRHSLFDIDPVFKVEPPSDDLRETAAAVERFGQRLLMDYMEAGDDLLRACEGGLRDGTEAIYQRWRTEIRERTTWQTVLRPRRDDQGRPAYPPEVYADPDVLWDEAGAAYLSAQDDLGQIVPGEPLPPLMAPRRVAKTEPATVYDGPEFVRVEVTRLGTYPAAHADVERSPILFLRYSEDWDTILQRVNAGEYDREAVESLRQQTPETGQLATAEDTQREVTPSVDSSRTKQWEPLDLIEAWVGYVPMTGGDPERADKATGKPFLVTLHEDSETILRAIPNPRWDGKRPVEPIMPHDVRFGILGISVPDLIGDVQAQETETVRLIFDRGHKDLRRPLAVPRGTFVGSDRDEFAAQNKPGGVFETDDPKAIMPLMDPSAPASAMLPLLQWLNDLGQRAGATVDPQLGVTPPGQRTLGEVQITTSQAQMRDQMLVRNCARSLARIWRLTLNNVYQCIANESMQKLWAQANPGDLLPPALAAREAELIGVAQALQAQGADEAQVGQALGVTDRQLWRLLRPEMLPGEWELHPERGLKITCWGVAEDANRLQNRQKWQAVGKAVLEDPDVNADPRRLYAAKADFYTAMGLDPKRYLGDEEEFVARKEAEAEAMRAAAEAEANARNAEAEAGRQAETENAQAGREHQTALSDRAHQQKQEQMMLGAALAPPKTGAANA